MEWLLFVSVDSLLLLSKLVEDMRRIPVTVNFDHYTHVGDLIMYDNLSDEEMKNLDVSWTYNVVDNKLKILEMTFIPKPAVSVDQEEHPYQMGFE
jgi:hypothetical protein